MDRKEFLNAIGMGAAAVAVFNCIGCAKNNTGSPSDPAPSNVDFTLDLTASANSALSTNGGYIYANGIIVARTTTGAYIAVSQTCTHENYRVIFRGSAQQFYCQNHGAAFAQNGAVINGPANQALKQYNTQLTGTNLRIYS
ncbi:Rieske 2Fe-2S domain-containing protein [Pelobium sp.]|nr:Rieske 2Fe-2S domain-containing protein [Pelobium sp.]MDA9554946.1 Rieske 2Fe-2S domain-containing protein [Pelobium sp.]